MREFTLKGQKIVRCRDKYDKLGRKMDVNRANQYLQDLHKALDQIGLTHCLMYGTLVGAIREEEIVYYDDDVDVVLFQKETKGRDIIGELKKILEPLGYYFCTASIEGQLSFFYIAKKDPGCKEKVDVYVYFEREGDNEKIWFPQYVNHRELGPVIRGFPYTKKYFDNLKKIDFLGESYNVPSPPEEFLEELWGDWWIAKGGQWGIIQAKHFPVGEFANGKGKIIK